MARLRYPTGVRPLLIEETARRRAVERRIVTVLERHRFAEVVLPIIDYAEAYGDDIDSRQTYRFVDRDGDLVAIRSDFTPMVARALAPAIGEADLPLRVFYRGDVIRCEGSRLGSNRELFQIGAEIIGDATAAADIDALSLVSEILRELGVTPLIVYSDGSIPERLGDSDGSLRRALAEKQSVILRRGDAEGSPSMAGGPSASSRLRMTLEALLAGTATIEDLREWPDVASRLKAIEEAAIPGCVLHLDDIDRDRGYYTGLRFRAYDAAARGVVVAQGGRYDTLYRRFGHDAPAVGFTITINDWR
jgi:ATP phosphoribosyltransferase regulatory subunit